MRAHPEWPANPGVEEGCDNRDCGVCYEPQEWEFEENRELLAHNGHDVCPTCGQDI